MDSASTQDSNLFHNHRLHDVESWHVDISASFGHQLSSSGLSCFCIGCPQWPLHPDVGIIHDSRHDDHRSLAQEVWQPLPNSPNLRNDTSFPQAPVQRITILVGASEAATTIRNRDDVCRSCPPPSFPQTECSLGSQIMGRGVESLGQHFCFFSSNFLEVRRRADWLIFSREASGKMKPTGLPRFRWGGGTAQAATGGSASPMIAGAMTSSTAPP